MDKDAAPQDAAAKGCVLVLAVVLLVVILAVAGCAPHVRVKLDIDSKLGPRSLTDLCTLKGNKHETIKTHGRRFYSRLGSGVR